MARRRKLPAGLWQRGDVYYARFRSHGRLIRERLSADFETARQLLNELRVRADRAALGLLDNHCSWKRLKAEFLAWARQSVRCWREYETDLRWFEQFHLVRRVSEIDGPFVVDFRQWRLDHGVTPRTVNKHVATLNNLLNRGVEWRRIAENPIAGLRPLPHDTPVKQRRSLTVSEVEAIFDYSADYLRPVWQMFMRTGLRKGELVEMRFADVDFDRRSVTVRSAVAKNHRRREVPLDDDVLDLIADLKARAGHRQPVPGPTEEMTDRQFANFSRDHVFVTAANTPWRNNLLDRFYATCRRAGIAGAHPGGDVDIHSLRVTFTTLALEQGATPPAVQSILGHSTLDLTMGIYARATETAKRQAVDVLPFAVREELPPCYSVPSVHNARTESPCWPQVA